MTKPVHPSERTLAEFVAGDLSATRGLEVVRHLLRGCPECRRAAGRLWLGGRRDRPAVEPALEPETDELAARVRLVDDERKRAEPLLAELEARPLSRRTMLAVNSGRFHNWFLAELISSRSEALGFDEPEQAIEYANLAVSLAEQLSERRYGRALVNDMRARTWGALGNAHRIASDLESADKALERAVALLEDGTGDPLELARVLRWRALHLRARRELEASARLFDRAIGLLRRLGDLPGAARMEADKRIARSTRDFEAAVRAERGPRVEGRPASAR